MSAASIATICGLWIPDYIMMNKANVGSEINSLYIAVMPYGDKDFVSNGKGGYL